MRSRSSASIVFVRAASSSAWMPRRTLTSRTVAITYVCSSVVHGDSATSTGKVAPSTRFAHSCRLSPMDRVRGSLM